MIIPIKTGMGGYNIVLERGALSNLKGRLNLERKLLIVTDDGVPEIYAKTVALQCKEPYIVTLKQGEESKNLENFEFLLSKMLELGFTRKDAVIAVGGGVVGDLSGFVAASFMRGVDFYNLPTTVLSQVDSSVGGKVAVDFKGYKNIVGAFYPPKAVIIDPETLKTLPKRQISNGLAEAVKMSLTSNKELFNLFETQNIEENIDKIIEESLRIKKYVVEADEKEAGLRKILNFGHTIGHAIESQNEFSTLYHGECVALGMTYMCAPTVKERLLKVLNKLDLPTKVEVDIKGLLEAISHDKKSNGQKITAVFVHEIGEFKMLDVTPDELEKILKGEFL